jgi:hypothetical protein
MRTAIGLVILAAGAILTFAVSAQVPGINLRLAGAIIMLTGIAELIVPSRAGAWLRGRMPTRGELSEPAADEAEDVAYPAFLLQDPAVLAAEVLNSARATQNVGGTQSVRPTQLGAVRTVGQRRGPHRIEDNDEA